MNPNQHSISEPTLDQLFADPIVQQLMRRDALNEPAIRQLLKQVAAARAEHER